jgi:hypothetical protein
MVAGLLLLLLVTSCGQGNGDAPPQHVVFLDASTVDAWSGADGGPGELTQDAGSGSAREESDAGGSPSTDASLGQDAADAAPATFNLVSVISAGNTAMSVLFDAPPDPVQATVLGNYSVPGLSLAGTPQVMGNTVLIGTAMQSPQTYTLTVSGITRLKDAQMLSVNQASFGGHGTFNVVSVAPITARSLVVTFDAPPTAAQATNAANYTIPGLTLSAPQLAGSKVTLATSPQSGTKYTLTVAGVTRQTEGDPLVTSSASFMGRAPFDVASAASTSTVSMTVAFDAPPTPAEATKLVNYTVPGLVLSGTPTLNGSTVTLRTSGQSGKTYTATVTGVTRAADGEPLEVKAASFSGTAVLAPTVTNVAVTATSPNNGIVPYNTGTATVKITGTDFATVACPAGVKLDDLDGADVPVGTTPTTCTVDSDTQITATFPAGIRTRGATGWNVIVTNIVGSNVVSAVPFVPVAGLLVSEVYTGSVANTDHEYFEIYNPTSTPIDTTAAGIGLRVHIRSSGGVDTNKALTLVTTGIIPSHGFLLMVSSLSDANDAWYQSRDYTFTANLVGNGGVYLSLSTTNNARVLDKCGWGTQPAFGFEGTALANIPSGQSAERKPAGGMGHATDTDANVTDFNAVSGVLTPRGSADAPQP